MTHLFLLRSTAGLGFSLRSQVTGYNIFSFCFVLIVFYLLFYLFCFIGTDLVSREDERYLHSMEESYNKLYLDVEEFRCSRIDGRVICCYR